MICPRCGNRQWTDQILVTGNKAWCSKCGLTGYIDIFLTNTPIQQGPIMSQRYNEMGDIPHCQEDKHRSFTPHPNPDPNQNMIFGPNGADSRVNSFAPPFVPPETVEIPFPPSDLTDILLQQRQKDQQQKDAEVLAQGGTQFETGAVRSSDKANVRYDLISPIGMRRLAETMEEGRQKYGYFNWERGMPIGDILNHALAHIYTYLSGVESGEDDLAHAAWNLFAAMHMEETHPHLNHQLRPHHPINKKDVSIEK